MECNVARTSSSRGTIRATRKPEPVSFPDPARVAVRGAELALLPLPKLIELKLASGVTAPHRLRDLADVLELIRVASLTSDFAEQGAPEEE